MSDPVSENEAWYDAEIAPALLAIGKRLEERGMSMVATVEYDPGQRGSTICLAPNAGLPMQMLHRCAHFAENVDGYLISLKRHCAANGIDTGSSIYLRPGAL